MAAFAKVERRDDLDYWGVPTRRVFTMLGKYVVAIGAAIIVHPLTVQALPRPVLQAYEAPFVMRVGGGCGTGNHRNRAGQCVGGPRAEVGQATSGTCPPGTRLGNNGRTCRRND